MTYRKHATTTAIFMMAVLVLGIWLSGCVTTRHIREVRADISRVEGEVQEVNAAVARIDSLIAANAEADGRLRADMGADMSELQRQLASLLESYNDLMQQIRQLNDKGVRYLQGSPGASNNTESSATSNQAAQQPAQQPPTTTAPQGVDCTKLYDDAFVLVVRGEYDRAITGFRDFLDKCPEHENVENAYYWIGESYYAQEKYVEAIKELRYVVEEFQGSPNLGRAIFKLARSNQELDQKEQAIELFQQLVEDFPGTLESEQAKEQLKVLR